ncbi:thioredoxin domain-containing protein [Serratia nevei]|uniref:DsbA family protein n=1 Tax=Serratia nevei TaxID=2703794 RepID=UPI00209D5F2B|nr:thioredoxin domain-containing protein [Serratia nevei]MCP1107766.1 thioredoxin domain-containing protein [Serratia nevei]
MPRYLFIRRRLWIILALAMQGAAAGAILLSHSPQEESRPAAAPTSQSGPPWIYGSDGARFTIVVYADFECPYCQTSIPQLLRWVKANMDVALQWHHLPLSAHEPVASREARLAECQGEVGGAAAFWQTVGWIYANTRGNGQGPAAAAIPPNLSPAVQACLDSERPAPLVRAQADEAAEAGITATPTLRLHDRETGRTLTIEGAVDGSVLLSALDWLSNTPDIASGKHGTP